MVCQAAGRQWHTLSVPEWAAVSACRCHVVYTTYGTYTVRYHTGYNVSKLDALEKGQKTSHRRKSTSACRQISTRSFQRHDFRLSPGHTIIVVRKKSSVKMSSHHSGCYTQQTTECFGQVRNLWCHPTTNAAPTCDGFDGRRRIPILVKVSILPRCPRGGTRRERCGYQADGLP